MEAMTSRLTARPVSNGLSSDSVSTYTCVFDSYWSGMNCTPTQPASITSEILDIVGGAEALKNM